MTSASSYWTRTGEGTRVVPRGERLTFSKSESGNLVPSTLERVQTLRSTFIWYVHHGLGAKSIADRLNQQGIPSPRSGRWSRLHGDKWSMGTMRDILRNPAYAGDMVWNRPAFGKFHRVQKGRAVPRRGGDRRPASTVCYSFDSPLHPRHPQRRGVNRRIEHHGMGSRSAWLPDES